MLIKTVKNKCSGGKTAYSKSKMHKITCIIFKFRALKSDVNYILLDLESHWLHDATLIQRVACRWPKMAVVGYRMG